MPVMMFNIDSICSRDSTIEFLRGFSLGYSEVFATDVTGFPRQFILSEIKDEYQQTLLLASGQAPRSFDPVNVKPGYVILVAQRFDQESSEVLQQARKYLDELGVSYKRLTTW